MKDEIWKPIKGHEGLYKISNYGRVKSLARFIERKCGGYHSKEKMLSLTKTTTGYWKVELSKNKKRKSYKVHRLVAIAFIDNPEGKPNVNHIDGNPLNNHVSNLEWCTQSENVKHAYETGLKNTNFHKCKDKIVEEYVKNERVSVKELSRKYKCSQKSISDLLRIKGIRVKSNYEIRNIYQIDREQLIFDFKSGLTNKEIAKKHNTNRGLIAAYRYKHKKGELIV